MCGPDRAAATPGHGCALLAGSSGVSGREEGEETGMVNVDPAMFGATSWPAGSDTAGGATTTLGIGAGAAMAEGASVSTLRAC